ncbi:multidrug efflux pump VmrA [Antarctobacter heliothermus]|uniref:Multidrug efflux pump VmrA n=1 Tax=Antarctobacter heliothermus TaxID=74033 RepID=A0A222E234_9RHOB|nr:MATE family efflux transporter [Antarctobacter heliothermus]ASP20289.1 multidrug efflux pump VmrA [Antarctobacter heliothermus]
MAAGPTQTDGRFLTGSTLGHVVRMTLTGAAGITFVFIVDAANLFWVSQLGQPILMAAIGYAFAIQFFTVSIGVGLMVGTTALVSRSIGRGERALAREQGAAGMLLTFLVQAVTAGTVVAFRRDFLGNVGASGEVLDLAARYVALSMPSLAIMAVGLCGSAVLRADGLARQAMMVTMGGGIIMLGVDPVLIYVLEMGLDGAALSVWIFRGIMAGLAIWYAGFRHGLLARPSLVLLVRHAPALLRVAVPAIVTQMATPFGNFLLTGFIAAYGDNAVAAWAVINRLTVVAFGGLFSLAGAIGGIFGQNFGARQFDRLRQTYRDAALFCVCYAGVVWLILMALTGTIAKGFGLTAEGATVLRAFTQIGALSFTLGGLLFVSNAAVNTLGRPLWASVLSWLRDGLLLWPAAVWLTAGYAAEGVVYAQALVGAVMGIVAGGLGWRYVRTIGDGPLPKVNLRERRAWRDPNRWRRR